MKLLTVGDSFTYGEELADLNSAWPYLLAEKLGYEVTNLAKPGTGNTRMVRTCIEQVTNYDIVIIAWSHFARVEWADQKGIYDVWPGCSVAPHKGTAEWRRYYIDHITHHYDDKYLYRQYLVNIILLQNFLKANNKKYIMFDVFSNAAKEERYIDTADLLAQIDTTSYWGWPDKTLMAVTWGLPIGPRGHFLNEGHAKVAEEIYNYMEQLAWLR